MTVTFLIAAAILAELEKVLVVRAVKKAIFFTIMRRAKESSVASDAINPLLRVSGSKYYQFASHSVLAFAFAALGVFNS